MTDDRWTWKINVKDRVRRPRKLGVAVENGEVIFGLLNEQGEVLGFSSAEPDEADLLAPIVKAASDRARRQGRSR